MAIVAGRSTKPLDMRIGRVVAAIVVASISAGIIYGLMLAYGVQAASHGPKNTEIVLTAAVVAALTLIFLVLVVLPLALGTRRSIHFRSIVVAGGIAAWAGACVGAYLLMGQGAYMSALAGVESLAVGVPAIGAFAAIVGKGPHA